MGGTSESCEQKERKGCVTHGGPHGVFLDGGGAVENHATPPRSSCGTEKCTPSAEDWPSMTVSSPKQGSQWTRVPRFMGAVIWISCWVMGVATAPAWRPSKLAKKR